MNWFQIVFLREQSQVATEINKAMACCELISNCIFTWAITSLSNNGNLPLKLWIDFKLYFYVSNHKKKSNCIYFSWVVNWFQIVFLREQSQDTNNKEARELGCELISNCIFTWAITRKCNKTSWFSKLWIDFKLYFYVSNHKGTIVINIYEIVVNWFQIVFLREQSQVDYNFN